MYNILKDAILSGAKYNLDDMQTKIDRVWVANRISDAQHEELTALAVEHYDEDELLPDDKDRLSALEERVHELEQVVALLTGSAPQPTIVPWTKPTSKDAYVQPDDGIIYEYDLDKDGTPEYYMYHGDTPTGLRPMKRVGWKRVNPDGTDYVEA